MRERQSIDIIGDASQESRDEVQEHYRSLLYRHSESLPQELKERILQNERPLTEQEKMIINTINEDTDAVMAEIGVEPWDIPAENFHILNKDTYNELAEHKGDAVTKFGDQTVLFNEELLHENPVIFGSLAFHEVLHMKAYRSVEVGEKEDIVFASRNGVEVGGRLHHYVRGMGHDHFSGLGEALISHQQKE